MITIDNSKIAGFQPIFREFRGFSLLFDEANEDRLYLGLDEALQKIGPLAMTHSFLFCPLPFSSYHVTVWDGVNDDNLADIKPEYQEYFRTYLRQLPTPQELKEPFAHLINNSALLADSNWSISFTFKKLSIWGGQVLVARLQAADDASRMRLAVLEKHRKALYDAFEDLLGIEMYRSYSPHVSLGYFANRIGGTAAKEHLEKWDEVFAERIGDISTQFDCISLYGFDDMTNFFGIS